MLSITKGRRVLVVVDPQNDFCHPDGSLYVPGAEKDIARIAKYIRERGRELTDIVVSMDSHDRIAIFHPRFWMTEEGTHPAPFTMITASDVAAKKFRAASDIDSDRTHRYLDKLEKRGGGIMVWPEHCIVSTWGHLISDELLDALDEWREASGRPVRYAFKGENPFREEFSIFDAPRDDIFTMMVSAEEVIFSGEALSHCVVESTAGYAPRAKEVVGTAQKMILLRDCTSPVAGFDRDECERRIMELGIEMQLSA